VADALAAQRPESPDPARARFGRTTPVYRHAVPSGTDLQPSQRIPPPIAFGTSLGDGSPVAIGTSILGRSTDPLKTLVHAILRAAGTIKPPPPGMNSDRWETAPA
jgi:hypothetical protein